ncbi:MAG: hypothetical protein IJE49_07125 [Agathobacter sp.]|nr:hypothetical protein [Agathobacter sp.]
MKKWKALLLLLGTVFVLSACGNDNAGNTESEQNPPYEKYTIVFDKNTTSDLTDDESFTYYTSGWGAQQKSSIVEIDYAEDAVIPTSEVPTPKRKGYYFAGWHTVPEVKDEDIVNGVSKYQVFFGNKLSEIGAAKVAVMDKKEKDARALYDDAMYIRDFETLTEDGTLTLYARWVEAKEVSNEEELRAIKDDLYGAYILTNDITLTETWEPIGAYYSNYEYFNDSWWTYAFRGNFDGNGHTIYGLKVNGAEIKNIVDSTNQDTIWHDDGKNANGTAAMFGAISYANISNLTIDGAQIHVNGENAYSGDYCYAATLACFDMASSMKNVNIKNTDIVVEYSDKDLAYAKSMFVAVAGLEAGGWSSTVSNCSVVDTKITVNAKTESAHGGELYMGGLIGECYATMKNNTVDVVLKLNEKDVSTAKEDTELLVNIGGMSAANTSSSGNTVNANMDISISKKHGNSLVSIGGYAGAQRYMTAEKNTVTGSIVTNFDLDEANSVVNIGSLLGRIDAYYASVILMYADGVTCGASGNTTNVTLNGKTLNEQMPESGLPSIDGKPITYVASKDYTDAEGNVYTANVDAVVEKYGSYVPKESMTYNIMYIKVE